MVDCESLKTKDKSSWVIPKVVAVAYGSFLLQSLSRSSNGVLQKWSKLELVAYESGRKESFDCSHDDFIFYIAVHENSDYYNFLLSLR